MRLEEFLGHGRCDAVTPARRERVEDDRCVEVALVIGGKDHRTVDGFQMLQPADIDAGEEPAEGKNPGRQTGAAQSRALAASDSTTESRSCRLQPPLLGRRRRSVVSGLRGRRRFSRRRSATRRLSPGTPLPAPSSVRHVRASSSPAHRSWCRGSPRGRARTVAALTRRFGNLWRLPASAVPARRSAMP